MDGDKGMERREDLKVLMNSVIRIMGGENDVPMVYTHWKVRTVSFRRR